MDTAGIGATLFIVGLTVGYFSAREESEKAPKMIIASGEGDYKMVLVVRKDLQMTKGKVAAQCAHAALACYEAGSETTPEFVQKWKSGGQAKIALQCDSLGDIQRLQTRAVRLGVTAQAIADAGRTQVEPGSITVLGIGPAPVDTINEITGHLRLY